MTGLDPIALAASAIAAGSAAAALFQRGAASTIATVGTAMIAAAAAAATFGAPAAAAFAVAVAAMLAILIVGADLVAPEGDVDGRPALIAAVSLLLIVGGLTFVMSDAAGPIARGPGHASPAGALMAASIVLAASSAAFALLGEDGRSALEAPALRGGRFPGREHAVSRGIGKGLSPLLAIAALSLAGPTAAPLAAGALLALALTLYALVFGLDAAVRAAPVRALAATAWAGLAIAAAATVVAATTRFSQPASVVASVAVAACVGGALGRTFYAIAGRLPGLPAGDAPGADGRRHG